jgi:hypothetical protein
MHPQPKDALEKTFKRFLEEKIMIVSLDASRKRSTGIERPAASATPAIDRPQASPLSDETQDWIRRGVEGHRRMATDEGFRKAIAKGLS